jgi:hypothetical protein
MERGLLLSFHNQSITADGGVKWNEINLCVKTVALTGS